MKASSTSQKRRYRCEYSQRNNWQAANTATASAAAATFGHGLPAAPAGAAATAEPAGGGRRSSVPNAGVLIIVVRSVNPAPRAAPASRSGPAAAHRKTPAHQSRESRPAQA